MYDQNNTTTDRNQYSPCPACDGKGYQRNMVTGINEPCPVCNGSGINFNGKHIITC